MTSKEATVSGAEVVAYLLIENLQVLFLADYNILRHITLCFGPQMVQNSTASSEKNCSYCPLIKEHMRINYYLLLQCPPGCQQPGGRRSGAPHQRFFPSLWLLLQPSS